MIWLLVWLVTIPMVLWAAKIEREDKGWLDLEDVFWISVGILVPPVGFTIFIAFLFIFKKAPITSNKFFIKKGT